VSGYEVSGADELDSFKVDNMHECIDKCSAEHDCALAHLKRNKTCVLFEKAETYLVVSKNVQVFQKIKGR
jgi:hypothetical protein